MKKWIPAGLAVLLIVALTINLTLYFDQQRLSQDVNALKTQRVQNGQERSRIATVGAEQRIDLVSTIGQQKGELERIQRLLQVQQASVQGLSRAIGNETQPGTVPAAASSSLVQYQTDLEGVRKDLSDLRGAVDKLKDYAFKLEKSLNLPAPDLNTPGPVSPDAAVTPGASPVANTTAVASVVATAADTATLTVTASQAANTASPGLTSTPKPFSNRAANDESSSSISNGNINLASYSIQLSAISQNINLLGSELQGLLQRYEKLEAAAASSKVARSNDSLNVPGIDAVLNNVDAQKLAALSYAPQGWPVRGPVTSPFGPRPNIFGPAPKTTTSSQPALTSRAFAENKGGNNLNAAPANTTTPDPASTGGVSMANVSPSVPVSTATPTPSLSPSPTIDTSKITPIIVPAAPNASPSLTVNPTITPTATITATVTAAATPSLTPTPKVTISASPSPSISVSPSPSISVSPGATASGPSVAVGINGGVSEVGPGMEFHTGIDIGVNEGSEVRATAAGVVEAAGDSGGYGKAVFIRHPGGFMTVYGHNSRLLVVAGQSVKAGELISLSGNTGYSTGPHVHYEVRYQNRVMDPAPFMK